MRTLMLLVGSLFFLTPSLYSSGYVDDFAFLSSLPSYQQFLEAVKMDGDAAKAEELRAGFSSLALPKEDESVLFIRSSVILARLYAEHMKGDKNRALQLLDEAHTQLMGLEQESFLHLMLSSEIDGVHYLLNPRNLSKGIRSNSAINKAYKLYPKQIAATLAKANSLAYAPSFAGGDVNKALSLYLGLLQDADTLLCTVDRASIYSGIGLVAMKRKEWQTAKQYFLAAKALSAFDPTLDAYLAEVEEKL
ncbi:MAG: hypothetical protein VB127_01195 [Sphaerochaeta sp.]|jgi:hypothetical protein|nr:hypothetical protein [Sphaerochaeta sp.]